ncbi:RNA polymerase sigma-70 factor, ECF subfamily [Chitinophaga ginsengisegetis]|uniref:RNA polymerase sigma-70 factor, ECF subfamily n=2 Tax=Chitinophagaceae TaxID=563835 RepID=A0A1T5P9Y2_9BACT|nr:RNA polymerase sigma-70 factor, ECF subfamily [Chitinophaga ginsengisegetis]
MYRYKNSIYFYILVYHTNHMTQYRQQTDADLIMFLREDKGDAFTEIYDRYWKKLLAIAYHHCRDKVIAEEIVQEVFIGLWNRRKELYIDNVNAYLATAVRLSVFKQYVRQKRRDEIKEQAADPIITTWDEEKIYTRFLQQHINGIVEVLPEKCRLVFKLSREEGLSIPEVAQRMGIAEKTAEAHLTKALKVLKVKLNRPYLWVIIIVKMLLS